MSTTGKPMSSDTTNITKASQSHKAGRLQNALLNTLYFIGQKIGFGILVVLFIIYLSYLGLDMASGTSFGTAARTAWSDSGAYILRLLQGDMGLTTAGSETLLPRPMSEVILERLPRSLGLLGISLAFAAFTGILLGFISARGKTGRSLGILIATLIGISIPSFFGAFLLQWLAISYTQKAGSPLLPVGGFGWDDHLILPMLVLAARPIAQITRISFVSVRDVLEQDYVRTAYSKGLRNTHVMWVHVLRNTAIPILTTISVSLRFSLSSLPVVEYYFGWPGAGFTLLKGIAQRDHNLTIGFALCFAIIFILINLILELCYRLIDPRIARKPDHISGGERISAWGMVKQLGAEFKDLLLKNALVRRLSKGAQEERNLYHPLDKVENGVAHTAEIEIHHRPSTLSVLLKNLPFTVGSLLVLGLLLLIFIGPYLAPNSPFQTLGLVRIDDKLTPPPFSPSDTFPWGTDALGRGIMSLLFSGAQQTLVLGLMVVGTRALIGVVLGTLAGWTEGGTLDRTILGLSEIIAAFPTLLIAMILILALGIRFGMPPFIIGLGLVGWGEIMQFVRGEVISIRPKLFIESAVATGVRTPRIIVRHVLPNLFSALIAIVSIEMGAVLMLLGELGFLGIFIGGGSLIALPNMTVLYSDVPEWGALLSNVRYLARSYPWTALYPMLAFFIAIVSFNLFGEGLRRLVAEGNLIINRIFNRYSAGLALIVVLGFTWFNQNSGAMPFYRQNAALTDGQRALARVKLLTDPRMYGRALGTPGTDLAALYIAREFEALGLQDAGEQNTYYQERTHSFGQPLGMPILNIPDGGKALVYGQDFSIYPGRNISAGDASGKIRLITLGPAANVNTSIFRQSYPDLRRANFSDEVIMTLSNWEAFMLSGVPKQGMLVVTDDPSQLQKRYTISGRSGRQLNLFTGEVKGEEQPTIWITTEVANRLLASSGFTVEDLRAKSNELQTEEVFQLEVDAQVDMEVETELVPSFPVKHVLGYIPGTSGADSCTICLGNKLIVVLAQYDAPPLGPDQAVFPAANNNASGIAVMLEAINVIQESGYQPYKTLMFIAYSGEGLDGGEPVSDPDINKFLQARTGFTNFDLEAVIHLKGVGGGSGDRLEIAAGGSLRLASLFEQAAKRMGVETMRANETYDISLIYGNDTNRFLQGGQEAPVVRLFWEGWDELANLPADNLQSISPQKLEDTGRTLALALMVLGRETEY